MSKDKEVMARQRDVSVLFHLTKKGVHASAVIRNRIKTRLKTALALVVTKKAAESPDVSGKSVSTGKDLGQLNYDGEPQCLCHSRWTD